MSLQCCVGTFTQMSGTGAQVVTPTGLTFQPKGYLFYRSAGLVGPSGYCGFSVGLDDGSHHRGVAINAGAFEGGADATETGFSDAYSLVTTRNSAAFQLNALGYVSASSTSTFTIQWDQNSANWSAGIVWYYLLIGGADIGVQVGSIQPPTSPGTSSLAGLSFAPTAIVTSYHQAVSGTTDSGSQIAGSSGLGFAAKCSNGQGYSSGADDDGANPSNSTTYQVQKAFAVANTTAGGTPIGSITTWNSDGITIDWATGAASPTTQYFGYLAIGGCSANFVTITQPATTGTARVTYPIANPQAVVAVTAGKAATTSISPSMYTTVGACDAALRQATAWTGDEDGKAPPAWVMRRYTNDRLVLTSRPTAENADTVTGAAAVTDLSQGSMGLEWFVCDGTLREIYALVLGSDDPGTDGCGGATPVVIATYATRRERVFSLPFDMNLWVFLQRLEILVQSGVGLSTGQGSDPKLMLSISRDGGHTYGNEMQLGVGKIGEYQARAFANRLGRGRNLVCKVACSDPVFFALLACFIDAEAGTS